MAKQTQKQRPSDMNVDQLRTEVGELKALRFQHRMEQTTGKLSNYRQIPQTKRRLAAVLTALREKELAQAAGKGSSK